MTRAAEQHAYATLGDLLFALSTGKAPALTPAMVALAARRSDDAARDWIRGESEPRFTDLALLIEHLPDAVVDPMLTLLLSNARYRHELRDEAVEADVNRDGRIDLADALDSAINALKAGQAALERVREAERRRQLDALAAVDIVAEIMRGVRAGETVVKILNRLAGKNGGPRLAV